MEEQKEDSFDKMEEFDVNKVQTKDPKVFIDVKAYEGTKWKIEDVKVRREIDPFRDELGNRTEFNPESKAMCWKAYISTEPLREYNSQERTFGSKILVKKNKDETETPIRVIKAFNLQESEQGAPEVSKHPKALLWKFMRKYGVSELIQLKGQLVMLDSIPSKTEGDTRRFLTIV